VYVNGPATTVGSRLAFGAGLRTSLNPILFVLPFAFSFGLDFSTFADFSTFTATLPSLGGFAEYWHFHFPDLQKWQRALGNAEKQIMSETTQGLQRQKFR
jgi:hypothetical protein